MCDKEATSEYEPTNVGSEHPGSGWNGRAGNSGKKPFRKISSKAFTRTQAAAELFDDIFFDGQRCDSLPSRPVLIINATNLQLIRAWRFTNAGMGDSRVGHANWGTNALRLSRFLCLQAASPKGVDARCLSGSTSSSAGSVHFRRASAGDRGHIPVSHHSCNNHEFPQNAACARDRRPGFRRVSCPAAP